MDYPILYKKDADDFSGLGALIIKNARDLKVHEVMNGEYTAEFDVPIGDELTKIAEYDDFIKVSGQLFRIRSISASRNSDGSSFIRFTCFHVWYDACDCKYIPHACTETNGAEADGWIGVTPRWVMETVFADTPFSVGEVEIDTETDIFATKSNPAEIMSILTENVGGEIVRDNYTVHLKKGGGQYNGKRIVYGKNLKSIEKTMDDGGVVTRLYPLGQDDLDISSVNGGVPYIDSPLIGVYGYIKCGWRDFSDIGDPDELKKKALSLWSTDTEDGIDKPKITYTVHTPDLENIAMGHTVRVTDGELGIDILTKVTETEFYPLEPHRGSIVLSNHREASVNIGEKILANAAKLEKITDKSGNIMSQYIDSVREKTQSEVEEAASKRLTVHSFGDIWVDNTDNPTRAMVISDGVFAAANSKKPNGDWAWRTIGTADKFIADTVNAPWLNAGYINTDEITVRSADGNASLSGNRFTISANDGSEAEMSSTEGFKYIYRRDANGNPYDYVIFNQKGQQRYWHGCLIPSTYQFAKGTVECKRTEDTTVYGLIELKGAAWKEIARVYGKIINDASLASSEKHALISKMIACSVSPIRITSKITADGAVIIDNEIVHTEIGEYSVPYLIETDASGTVIDLKNGEALAAYDGAAMLYYGTGGYVRSAGSSMNRCYSVEAVYDIAVTLDLDYN